MRSHSSMPTQPQSKAARDPGSRAVEEDAPLPVRQRRSGQTAIRLLDAAERVLKEKGVDAATLRAIADRAGVSIAIVYRRFRDKDSVLRAVYQRFFSGILEGNRRALRRAELQELSMDDLLPMIVRSIAEGYRRHRRLLRPLLLYARTHPDSAFRRRARRLNAAVYDTIRERLLQNPGAIRHPNPEMAVAFSISAIAAMLQEREIFDDASALPALTESDVVREATRMLRCYLGLQQDVDRVSD